MKLSLSYYCYNLFRHGVGVMRAELLKLLTVRNEISLLVRCCTAGAGFNDTLQWWIYTALSLS